MFLRSMIALGAILTATAFANPPTSQLSAELLKKKREIYDGAASIPTLRNWIDSRMREVLKDPLDADVDAILKNSQIVRSLLPEVMKQLDSVIVSSSIEHMRDAALVTPGQHGQYQWLGEIVDKLAADLNFSPKSRKEMQIWVVSNPAQNAYTFSGDRERIRVVFFEGLLKQMARDVYKGEDGITRYKNTGELEQVTGHELFHIKGGHIENRLMLYSIFYATGKNLIPREPQVGDDEDEDERDLIISRKREVRSVLNKMAQSLVPHAEKFLTEGYVERLSQVIEDFAKKLVSRMGQRNVDVMTQKIFHAMRALPAAEPVDIDIKALKEFEEDLKRLGRSQETSCDNAGYIVTKNHEASVLAYARLGGGSEVTFEAVMAQADQLARLFNGDPALEAEYGKQEGTHPVVIARAKQFDIFRHTDAYKTYSDDFKRVLRDYLALSKTLLELDRRILSRNQMELTDRGNLSVNRDDLTTLARAMSDWIEEAVIQDLATAQVKPGTSPAVFLALLEGLRDSISEPFPDYDFDVVAGFDMQRELGRKRRLVQNLILRVSREKTLLSAKLRERVKQVLENLVPPETHFPVPGAECVVELLNAGIKDQAKDEGKRLKEKDKTPKPPTE